MLSMWRTAHSATGATRCFLRTLAGRSAGPGTLCVHAAALKQDGGSLTTPIYSSVATVWPNAKSQHIYPRYNTGPNVELVSARIAALEGGEAGIVFSSGMAAITSVLFTFLQSGDHCVMSEVNVLLV